MISLKKIYEAALKKPTISEKDVDPNELKRGIEIELEHTDDRNIANGDGCSANCRIESGFTCTFPTPNAPSLCSRQVANTCGNGLPNPGEQCDDTNNFNGDGCSSTCFVEPGYNCTLPTVFSPSFCTAQPVIPSTGMVATQVIINSNTIYVILLIDTVFTFANTQEMTSFMQYQIAP